MHYLFAILGAVFIAVAFYLRKRAAAAALWPSTRGVVVESSLANDPSNGRFSFSIRYQYSIAQQSYINSQVSFALIANSYQAKQDVVSRYPVGQEVTVYYNPDSPQDAVLENQQTGGWILFVVVGAIFVLFGLFTHWF